MLRYVLANMLRRFAIAHAVAVAQRNIANIFIEMMPLRIAVIIGFIGAYRVFIPFAGKHALPAYRFKATANSADPGEEIDKTKGIMRMVCRRRWQQCPEVRIFALAQTMPRRCVRHDAFKNSRAPVVLPNAIQMRHQRFHIIDFQQFAQQRLYGSPGIVCHQILETCY